MGSDLSVDARQQRLRTVVLRELRRDRSIAPGGTAFADLIRAILPLVYGSARVLMPGSPSSVEDIVLAVFRSFAFRWRRLPRRTVMASWLFRSTWFAALRERKRLRRSSPEQAFREEDHHVLFRTLCRLRTPAFDALIVRCVLGESLQEASRVLRHREARVVKLVTRGLATVGKGLRKKQITSDPSALLSGIVLSPPDEFSDGVVSQMGEWSPRQKRDPLVQATLGAWRWLAIRGLVRRGFVAAAWCFLVIVATGVTMGWLVSQGYLTAWFIRQSSRQLAKEIPELAEPARPWPNSPADAALVTPGPPQTAAELYGLTNIWIAKLWFTSEEWEGIQPSRVPPVPMMQDGHLVLRNPKAQRSGLAGVVGLDFNWVKARLEFAGQDFGDVAVRYRGNGTYLNSLFGPKQPFKVDLNKFVKGQRLAGIRTLNFVNAIPDNSYLHDALGEQLFRDLGVVAPRTAFAYLTVSVDTPAAAQPLGLYVLVENIDADFAADRFGTKEVPIFKPVTTELFKDLGDDWEAYAGIYDLKTKATPEQLKHLIQFARLVSTADDAEFARRLPEFLDLEEVAAFVAGHVLLAAYDGFLANGQNFYLYLNPQDNRFGLIPWDHDHSWGEFGYVATADQRERASIWQPATYRHRFLERILKVEEFRVVYRRHLERALAEWFTIDRLFRQIDQVGALIRPAVAAESAFRLKRFDVALSTNWTVGRRDGAPEGPKAPVHQMKRFITNRVKSIRDQLDGKAEGVVLAR